MRALGHVAGRSVDIEYRFSHGDYSRLRELATELVQIQPDVILGATGLTAVAAGEATASIPIVCPLLGDIIASRNDARPERNITGVRDSIAGLGGKLIDLARELSPSTRRIGVMANSTGANVRFDDLVAAAQSANLEIVRAAIHAPPDLDLAFERFANEQVNLVLIHPDSLFFAERARIARLALAHKIASIYAIREHVLAGGLASYGVDFRANFHRAASYVDRLLKGARISDLPIEFATKFLVLINLTTARSLNITVPPTLLARADEVIE
jgi:putative ABC transport system substrate-binding protein